MSCYIHFTGNLELNKILNASDYYKVYMKLRSLKMDFEDTTKVLNNSIGEKVIKFYENGRFTDEVISVVVDVLKDCGYEINGVVEYYGDYDGKVFVSNNKVTVLEEKDCWKMEASIEEIRDVLKSRLKNANIICAGVNY